METDRTNNTSKELLTSDTSDRRDKNDSTAKRGKKTRPKKEHQLVSPKLVFLKRKVKHTQKRAQQDRESVLGRKATSSSIELFIAIYSLLVFTRGAFRQYFPNTLEHIHRQFTLSVRELEFLSGLEKIGFMLLIVFVGYYGNKMHKPIGLLVGSVFCASGVILCACPYFTDTAGIGRPGNSTDMSLYFEAGLCQVDTNETKTSKTQCEALLRHPEGGQAFSFLAGGNFLIGIGSTFILVLGFIYIEESSHKDTAALYYGIVLFMNGVGETLGLIAAWQFTKLSYTLEADSLGVDSWNAGAWWLALPILATLFLFVSLPLLMFPKWIVEPKWLINRRNRRLKRWLYLLKVEEKLVNKIKRKQRRKKRKEENAKRRREKQKQRAESEMVNSCVNSGGTTQKANRPNLGEGMSADGNCNDNDAYEADDSESGNRNACTVNGDAVSDKDEHRAIQIEAEVHTNNETNAQDVDENKDFSDDESEEEETNTEQSPPDFDQTTQERDYPEFRSEDLAVEQSDDLTKPEQSRGVHFAVDDEGKILAETRIEDILQMEEPPQEPAALEDSEPLNSERSEKERKRQILGRRIQDLPKNLWFIVNRPVFSVILAGTVMAAFSPAGYQATLANYLSAQLAVYQPKNYLIAGIPYTLGFSFGTLLSGFVIHKRSWKLMTHVKIIVIIQCIVVILFLFAMIPTCDIQYVFRGSPGSNMTLNLECSHRCDCRQTEYEPVCSKNGLIFPSGCTAGCRDATSVSQIGAVVYSKCLCLPGEDLSPAYCSHGCVGVASGYGFLVFLIAACQNFGLVSLLIICLRGISQKLRSLSLAFAEAIIMLSAFVPGVAVFRVFRTVACLYEEASCLDDNVCWLYKRDTYRYLQHGATSLFQLISVAFYVAAVVVIRSKVKAARQLNDGTLTGQTSKVETVIDDEQADRKPSTINESEENSQL